MWIGSPVLDNSLFVAFRGPLIVVFYSSLSMSKGSKVSRETKKYMTPRFWISVCKIYRPRAKWAKSGFSEIFQKISDEKLNPTFEFGNEY